MVTGNMFRRFVSRSLAAAWAPGVDQARICREVGATTVATSVLV